MPDTAPLKKTHLHAAHQNLKARLVPFAGYDMPVQYTSIIAEAKAVRTAVGMFDVSHMGRLAITGADVLPFLENVTTNDVAKLEQNTGQYSLLPNDQGGCVDDIILYRLGEDFQMVVNASNHEKAVGWLKEHIQGDVSVSDLTEGTSMVAVQGPAALQTLSHLSQAGEQLSSAPAFGIVRIQIAGKPVQAARSGYTGEDGFELVFSGADSEIIWNALLEAGVVPCGLGARDTLRVEAGLPLYGHELSDTISPIAAGLGWVVSKTKPFIGSDKINAVRDAGPAEKLVGVKLDIKRLITPEMKISVDGRQVGSVTSGIISPLFDTALALGFIDSSVKLNTPCTVDARGKEEPGMIVSKRFYKRG